MPLILIAAEPDIARQIQQQLGPEHESAITTVKEADEAAKTHEPDAIVADLASGPGAVLSLLKPLRDSGGPPVILFASGFVDDLDREGLRAGAYDYLPSLDVDQLRLAVRNAIEKQFLVRQNRAYEERLRAVLAQLEQSQAALVQTEKLNSMARLVAGVAHEVNTPLGVLQSTLDTLDRAAHKLSDIAAASPDNKQISVLTETIAESAKEGRAACERLSGVVSRLRTFAQLDRADFQRARVEPGLESAVGIVTAQLPDGATIRCDIQPLPEIDCSPRDLNQMFLNLLQNAVEAVAAPEVMRREVTVRAWTESNEIRISIADSGPGIDPEDLQRIFDPGFTKKGVQVGTGLGLPIALQTARMHDGNIEVESKPGEGTAFTVILPVRQFL